jgi:hypothetical protein
VVGTICRPEFSKPVTSEPRRSNVSFTGVAFAEPLAPSCSTDSRLNEARMRRIDEFDPLE